MDNCFNEVFSLFDPLNPEISLGSKIIDIFSSHFSFYFFSKHKDQNFKSWIQQLDKVAFKSSSSPSSALVITDASVKNNVVTSIVHIHIHNKLITKTLYYTLNVTSTKAELFTIRSNINQATNLNNILKIIVITNSIHVARKIFDILSHPFQKHSAIILNKLRAFFSYYQENSIEFWECLSWCNWHPHKIVNVETKSFNPTPLLSSKLAWDYSKKNGYNDLINI